MAQTVACAVLNAVEPRRHVEGALGEHGVFLVGLETELAAEYQAAGGRVLKMMLA